MFEAIHGSAPRRAGQNVANPSGLMLGAVLMLVHIGQSDTAERFHNAWLKTIEDGIHTYDIYKEGTSKEKVGTREFAQAVIGRLGQRPEKLRAVSYKDAPSQAAPHAVVSTDGEVKKAIVGVDVFLDWSKGSADELGAALSRLAGDDMRLRVILNRGTKVWPEGMPETKVTDQWRCRFMAKVDGGTIAHGQIVKLLERVTNAGFDFVQTENLQTYDGKPGYSTGSGE
jgi:isocitrate dehydrogenase